MSKPVMPCLNRNQIDRGSSRKSPYVKYDRGSSRKSPYVKYIKSFNSATLANHPLSVCFLNCEGIREKMEHKGSSISESIDRK